MPARAPAQVADPPDRIRGVLVVDDEPVVHQVAESFLERLGLVAQSVETAAAALDEADRRGADIDAVLLDETMPGVNGHEIIGELRAKLPHAPIVLMSGHAQEDLLASCGEHVPDAWLSKPFTAMSLGAALRQAHAAVQDRGELFEVG